MIATTKARLFLSLLSVASLALVACGGSEAAGDSSDTSPAADSGSDARSDSGGADATDAPVDAPVDSPVARTPKQHRPAAVACTPSKGTGGGACASTGGPPSSCKADSECTAGANGHCAQSGGGVFMCSCFYDTCVEDSDCKTGGPCSCEGSPYQYVANACAPAGNCKVDADCGAAGFCSPSGGAGCSGSIAGYYCHVPADECVDDDDCKSATGGPQTCTFDTTKSHWACTPVLACP